jgi:signal peptidase II
VPGSSASTVLAVIVVAVVGLDQLTKAIVTARLGPSAPESRIAMLGEWLQLEYAENRGAAFGLLSGLVPVLTLASVAVVLWLLFQFGRGAASEWWRAAALGLIVGGAIGNFVDRVRLGYVVDFIAVGPWPNFNVADSAISLGVIALLWGWVRDDARSPSPERS